MTTTAVALVPESQLVNVPYDDRTSRGIPLPHPGNSMILDAIRIRAGFLIVDDLLGANADEIRDAVAAAIAPLLAGAPSGLNTFAEIAAALGGNANFAADITAALGSLGTVQSSTIERLGALATRVAVLEDQGLAFTNRLHFGGL